MLDGAVSDGRRRWEEYLASLRYTLVLLITACSPCGVEKAAENMTPGDSQGAASAHEPIKCPRDKIENVAEVRRIAPQFAQGYVLVDALLDECGASLPERTRRTLQSMADKGCGPEDVLAFPARVDQFLDFRGADPELPAALAGPYQLMRGNCLHRTYGVKIPEMKGGVRSETHDVEVKLREGKRSFRGEALPEGSSLAAHLPSVPRSSGFVAVAGKSEEAEQVIRLLTEAQIAGFSRLGILVRDGYDYRVVPVTLGGAIDEFHVHVGFLTDGFSMVSESAGGPGLLPSRVPELRGRRPDVELVNRGADVDDPERWDWDGLDKLIERHTEGRPGPMKVSVTVEDRIFVRDVVTVIEHLQGSRCGASGRPACRFSEVALIVDPP